MVLLKTFYREAQVVSSGKELAIPVAFDLLVAHLRSRVGQCPGLFLETGTDLQLIIAKRAIECHIKLFVGQYPIRKIDPGSYPKNMIESGISGFNFLTDLRWYICRIYPENGLISGLDRTRAVASVRAGRANPSLECHAALPGELS